MKFSEVQHQAQQIISRLIRSGLSVQQKSPSDKRHGDIIEYGSLPGMRESKAMKSIPYKDIYDDLCRLEAFHVKLVDGSLVCFQYLFNFEDESVIKHRLSFYPSPKLPEYDEMNTEYCNSDIYVDVTEDSLVKFPIRFDYDRRVPRNLFHPTSHVTLGQYTNCRIPVSSPVSPNKFVLFILRNFYHTAYIANKNIFEKRMRGATHIECLSNDEKRISHFII